MIISRRELLFSALALAVVALPQSTAAASWELLGRRQVALSRDRDVIPVTVLRGDFRRIKLTVAGNGVFIDHVVVTYSNGATDRLAVRALIRAGGETRNLDLRGVGDRYIRSVRLVYRSVRGSRDRAQVSVYGRR